MNSSHFCFGFCDSTKQECKLCPLYQECRKYQIYGLYDLIAHALTYVSHLKQHDFSLTDKKICLAGLINLKDIDPNLPLSAFFASYNANIVHHVTEDTDFVIVPDAFLQSGIKNTNVEIAKRYSIPYYSESEFKKLWRDHYVVPNNRRDNI